MTKRLVVRVRLDDDDDDENAEAVELPGKHVVCANCEGHGTHLRPGMREHAYTWEEFNEAFHDDEDREAYFERGGKYDVQCETCRGLRVVVVVDESITLDERQREAFELLRRRQRDEREYQALCRSEARFGC